jgi:hypothetical protein
MMLAEGVPEPTSVTPLGDGAGFAPDDLTSETVVVPMGADDVPPPPAVEVVEDAEDEDAQADDEVLEDAAGVEAPATAAPAARHWPWEVEGRSTSVTEASTDDTDEAADVDAESEVGDAGSAEPTLDEIPPPPAVILDEEPLEPDDVIEEPLEPGDVIEEPAEGTPDDPGAETDSGQQVEAEEANVYEPGALDMDDYACSDCVYEETCPKKDDLSPADCGSFQWKSG